MKLYGGIKINGKDYPKGSEVAWYQIYPFFLLHMLMFGGSGFLMAYASDDIPTAFLFLHGTVLDILVRSRRNAVALSGFCASCLRVFTRRNTAGAVFGCGGGSLTAKQICTPCRVSVPLTTLAPDTVRTF